MREYVRRYRERHPERVKAYLQNENPERRRERWRRYKARHPERLKGFSRQWRQRNPEKVKARNREWSVNNPERKAQFAREWNAKNPGRKAALWLRWYENNRGRYRAIKAKRRAALLNATPAWVDTKELRKIYENCPEGHHVDHIIPLVNRSVSGLHVPWNLQYLPALENQKKSNKLCP